MSIRSIKRCFVLMVMVVLFLFLVPIIGNNSAEAINGTIGLDFKSMSGAGTGSIELYQNIGRFRIGGVLETELLQFQLKDGWLPAGAPVSQLYSGYVKFKLTDQITISAESWCRHYFKQDSRNLPDKQDISLKVEYIFKM